MKAKPINDIPVNSFYTMPNGIRVAEVRCENYLGFSTLPGAVEVSNMRLGKSGWNSDQCVAYYRSDVLIAKVIKENA